jgi:hypothetical protein
LLQLMPGFCTHRLPSSLKYRLVIVQSNRRVLGWSKAGGSRNIEEVQMLPVSNCAILR